MSIFYRVLGLIGLLLLTFPLHAHGQHIHDEAGILEPDNILSIEQMLKNTDLKDNLHLEVVILPSSDKQLEDKTVNKLFQESQKNATQNSHSVLLVMTQNGQLEIKVPQELSQSFTPAILDTLKENIQQKIQDKDFNSAITVGITGIEYYYKQRFVSKPLQQKKSRTTLINVALFFLIFFVLLMIRKRHRKER